MTDRILEPVERLSEILFGLIMALTITCAVSVATADRVQINHMVIAALGCSFAWGIIDAGMYLMAGLGERGPAALTMSIGKNTRKPVAAASATPRAIGKAKSDMRPLSQPSTAC